MNKRLSDRTFRANATRELVVFDRLSRSERRLLGDQLEDPSLYGVLRPATGSDLKVVDRDVALLLFTLHTPGPLPSFLRREMEQKTLHRWLRGLLAAEILEVRQDGQFFTGNEALNSQHGNETTSTLSPDSGPSSRLHRLSQAALAIAAALPAASRQDRSRWLYDYNRQPMTPFWHAKLGTEEAVREWLGLDSETGARLDASGSRLTKDSWISWSFGHQQSRSTGPTYKLYVSPRLVDTPAALDCLSKVLDPLEAYHLKIGRNLEGLLRADKLILYFGDLDTLSAAAAKLAELFLDLQPQGVPFTANIGLGGLLSWGADPPGSRDWSTAPIRESWRQWLTERLATAFDEIEPSSDKGSTSSWQQVIDLIALEGIDTDNWSPDPQRWLGLENDS